MLFRSSNVSETGLAVLAILAVDPTASLGNASSFLKSAQLPDGSWGSNAYQTALAMHALRMPPVVGTIPGQSIINPYSFVPITLDNFVHDPDNTANQMQWSASGNILLSVSVVNRVAFITYSPSNNPSISEQLTFTATDPSGFTGSATATFVVSSNQPPVVSPIPGQNVGAPQPFAAIYLDNYVTDPDEATNQLTWTVTGNTQLVVSVSNRVVNITYNTNISTAFTEWLTFKATDPAGLSGASTTNFSVAPDQAPVVSGIPGQTVTAPYAFSPINLDNYVNDPDNAGDTMVFAKVTPPSYNVQIQLPPSSAGKTINVLTSNFQVIASTTANGPVWAVPLKRGTYMVKIVGNGQEKVFDVRGSEPDPPGISVVL